MFIVTELYPTNLQAVIDNKQLELPMPAVLRVSMGIANGLRFLHSLGLVHRDVKAANVLLSADLDAKITDFGTTRVVPRDRRMMMTGGIGTLEFMAPEVMAHEAYSKKADVYSFAIVVWQMLGRDDPFGKVAMLSIPDHVMKGGRPAIPPSCPPKLSLLIRTCWHQKPKYRPEFAEVCRFLQVIAGLSPEAFETTTDYFRKCAEVSLPRNAPIGYITEMQAGTVMLKCGRSGRPHFALFQLSDDAQYLQWTSRKKDPG
jgi:serine/threonine protein kinase